jgi:hypothetical protein
MQQQYSNIVGQRRTHADAYDGHEEGLPAPTRARLLAQQLGPQEQQQLHRLQQQLQQLWQQQVLLLPQAYTGQQQLGQHVVPQQQHNTAVGTTLQQQHVQPLHVHYTQQQQQQLSQQQQMSQQQQLLQQQQVQQQLLQSSTGLPQPLQSQQPMLQQQVQHQYVAVSCLQQPLPVHGQQQQHSQQHLQVPQQSAFAPGLAQPWAQQLQQQQHVCATELPQQQQLSAAELPQQQAPQQQQQQQQPTQQGLHSSPYTAARVLQMPPVDSNVMRRAATALRSRSCLPVTFYNKINLQMWSPALTCTRCCRYTCKPSCPYR